MEDVSKGQGRTVLFVSHQMGTLAQLCKTSVLLNSGRITMKGETRDVIDRYLNGMQAENVYKADLDKVKHKDAFIISQRLVNSQGEVVNQITNNDEIILEIGIVINKWNDSTELSISLQNKIKGRIFTINKPLGEIIDSSEKQKTIRFTIPANTITPNHYSWLNSLHIAGHQLIDVLWDECNFTIVDAGTDFARYEGVDYGVIVLNNYQIKT